MQERIERVGGLNGKWIKFVVETGYEWDAEDAMQFQDEKGYPVEGYGFEKFRCDEQAGGDFRSQWCCYASAD